MMGQLLARAQRYMWMWMCHVYFALPLDASALVRNTRRNLLAAMPSIFFIQYIDLWDAYDVHEHIMVLYRRVLSVDAMANSISTEQPKTKGKE